MNITPEERNALKWWIDWSTGDMQQRIWFWENKANTTHPFERKGYEESKRMFEKVKELQERFKSLDINRKP